MWRRLVAALGLGAVTTIGSAAQPTLDATPDLPKAFGYKVSWFAVRTQEPRRVVEALGLGGGAAANWKSGTEAAYRQPAGTEAPRVFVSPPIGAWVFVVGASLPFPDGDGSAEARKRAPFYELFHRLSQAFGDVQFFGSHRVVGLAAWARASQGKVTRAFAFADGSVYANVGPQSAEERQLGFADLAELAPAPATDRLFAIAQQRDEAAEKLVANGMPPTEATARIRRTGRHPIPDEDDVIELAARWSVNPDTFPPSGSSLGAGVVIDLPKRFASR